MSVGGALRERFAAALSLRASPYSFPPDLPCVGSDSGDDLIRFFDLRPRRRSRTTAHARPVFGLYSAFGNS